MLDQKCYHHHIMTTSTIAITIVILFVKNPLNMTVTILVVMIIISFTITIHFLASAGHSVQLSDGNSTLAGAQSSVNLAALQLSSF